MTKYLNPVVLDKGLLYLIQHSSRFVVLSAAPTDFASVAGLLLGTKQPVFISGPATSGSGRKVTLHTITDGVVSADGIVTHWAILNDPLLLLLANGEFATPLTVTGGNAFTTAAFDIILPGLV